MRWRAEGRLHDVAKEVDPAGGAGGGGPLGRVVDDRGGTRTRSGSRGSPGTRSRWCSTCSGRGTSWRGHSAWSGVSCGRVGPTPCRRRSSRSWSRRVRHRRSCCAASRRDSARSRIRCGRPGGDRAPYLVTAGGDHGAAGRWRTEPRDVSHRSAGGASARAQLRVRTPARRDAPRELGETRRGRCRWRSCWALRRR